VREGRHFTQRTDYLDISPDFRAQTGFVNRTNIRSLTQDVTYLFRPQGKSLLSWGPSVGGGAIWDHEGTRLDWELEARLDWEFNRQTKVGVFYAPGRERLRPEDFAGLGESVDFPTRGVGVSVSSQYVSQLTFSGSYSFGKEINLVPLEGDVPVLADSMAANIAFTARPNRHLLSENSYVLSRLSTIGAGDRIFTNHLLRSKWNWQFNPELGLRVILQYETVLANQSLTRLETRKNFNADVLFTWMMNAWTALHVGYNGNLQNIALEPTDLGDRIIRTEDLYHDARQFFVKFSYFFSF
jgi:hypothetical protein